MIQYLDLHILTLVCQDSILAPTLVLIYINDLPSSSSKFNSKIATYVDDTSIITKAISLRIITANAHYIFTSVADWLITNNLVLNREKSQTFAPSRCSDLNTEQLKVSTGFKMGDLRKLSEVNIGPLVTWVEHIKVDSHPQL